MRTGSYPVRGAAALRPPQKTRIHPAGLIGAHLTIKHRRARRNITEIVLHFG
jgi:hypothetical protein